LSRFAIANRSIWVKESEFSNHTIQYNNTDQFYLSTDEYADQYSGPLNKKYKSKQLLEPLNNAVPSTFSMQNQKVHSELLKWKGENEQIDDVTVFGFKYP
jgi:hypothetical protein